ncbi:DUF4142 domain-containing protein [Streptomyces sp. NPDC054841]
MRTLARFTPLAGTGLVVVAVTATIAALVFPLWSYADRAGTHGTAGLTADAVPTRWGPLSAADRDFIVQVRLAGLWALPAGQQAVGRAPSRAVTVAGLHLVEGHTYLDARVREVASRLTMELPSQPTDRQRDWLTELTDAHGQEYAVGFANTLRQAHGTLFTLIAEVRHTTRNSLVRALADDANTAVLDHIECLEATGLVDFDAIAAQDAGTAAASPTGPPPPAPGRTPRPAVPVTPSPKHLRQQPAAAATRREKAPPRQHGSMTHGRPHPGIAMARKR